MTVLSISRRQRGDRLVVVARGTLTTAQVPRLAPLGELPRGVERVELHLAEVRFDMGTLATLARLVAEAPVPVQITPEVVRQAVESAAEAAFAGDTIRTKGGGRPAGLCIVDPQGRIRLTNAQARAGLGLSLPDGGACWDDVRPPGRDPVADAAALHRLAQLRRADGWTFEAVPLATGGAVVSIIPPEGPARAAAEQNDALAQVAVAAAHEIRNPLAAIRAAIQLLQGKLSDTPHASTLVVVLGEIDKLASLLDHYLLLSRPSVRRDVDLASIAKSSLFFMRQDPRSDGVAIRPTFPTSPVRVLADADKLRQVLVGLLANALDACGATGEIQLEVVPDPEHGEASITIRDSGPGFPAEVLAAPFETFRTSKPGSAGLGLINAQEVVAAHGGRLHLFNTPHGQGAEVVVTLPTLTPLG